MVLFSALFILGLSLMVCAAAFEILFERPALGLYWEFPLMADSLSGQGFWPVRPVPLILSLTVWGAVGLFVMGATTLSFSTALALSLLSGAIAGAAACRVLCIPRSDKGLVGALATVEEDIPADGWGTVRVRYAGGPVIMRALCVDGEEVPRGEKVILLFYRDGIFVVEPEKSLDDESPARMEEPGQGGESAVIAPTESD